MFEEKPKENKTTIETMVKINGVEVFLKSQDSIKNYCTTMALKDTFTADYCAMLFDMCACITLSSEKIGIGIVCKKIDFIIDMPETSNLLLPKDLQVQQEKFPSLEIQFNPDKENYPFLHKFGYKVILMSKAKAQNNITNAILYAWKILLLHVFTTNIQQIGSLAAQYSFMQWIERVLVLEQNIVIDNDSEIKELHYEIAREYIIFISNLQQYFALIQTTLQERSAIKNKILRA